MRFQPKSASEISSGNLLAPGTYDCEVVTAEEATSKAGNEMLKLRLNVFDENGSARTLFDYLMAKVEYKLRHAAEAFGLIDAYEAGELNAVDFEGRTGRCKVVIQKGNDAYPDDKNSIQDYVPSEAGVVKAVIRSVAKAKASAADLEDSIPF